MHGLITSYKLSLNEMEARMNLLAERNRGLLQKSQEHAEMVQQTREAVHESKRHMMELGRKLNHIRMLQRYGL